MQQDTFNYALDPTVQTARTVAFALAVTEDKLGLTAKGIPLASRLEAVMQTAMERPAAITPDLYKVMFLLHSAIQAPTTETA
jgi:hypothetical protein